MRTNLFLLTIAIALCAGCKHPEPQADEGHSPWLSMPCPPDQGPPPPGEQPTTVETQLKVITDKAGTSQDPIVAHCRTKATTLKTTPPANMATGAEKVGNAADFAEAGQWAQCKDELDGIE